MDYDYDRYYYGEGVTPPDTTPSKRERAPEEKEWGVLFDQDPLSHL